MAHSIPLIAASISQEIDAERGAVGIPSTCYPARMVKVKPETPPLTDEQSTRFAEIARNAVHNFEGSSDELEAALGMYILGVYMGWKPLVLMHSKKTVRKYEQILGITVREEFDEEGPTSERSRAFGIARGVSNFWKAVSGEDKSIDKSERKLLQG
jgi:hypothetical protein